MNISNKIKALLAFLDAFFESLYAEGLKLVYDTRAEANEFTAPVMILIGGIMWVICIPIYVTQVQDTNTTAWSFTGSAGAITLYLLMPFCMIAGGVVWILKKVLK